MRRIFIAASGPSLTLADCMGASRCGNLMVVNGAVFTAPFADFLYAGDAGFWKLYNPFMRWFQGKRYTITSEASKYGCRQLKRNNTTGSLDLNSVGGISSGHQAIAAAYMLFQPEQIVLLGFDCKWSNPERKHSHGNHPRRLVDGTKGCGDPSSCGSWIEAHRKIAEQADRLGIDIVNASRDTAIDHYRKATLTEVVHGRTN